MKPSFTTSVTGYRKADVDRHIAVLMERVAALEAELLAARGETDNAQARLQSLKRDFVPADEINVRLDAAKSLLAALARRASHAGVMDAAARDFSSREAQVRQEPDPAVLTQPMRPPPPQIKETAPEAAANVPAPQQIATPDAYVSAPPPDDDIDWISDPWLDEPLQLGGDDTEPRANG